MDRRSVLKSVVATVAGVGLSGVGDGAAVAKEKKTRMSRAKGQSMPFIETSDGVRLFYRDWGKGEPLVFLAPWGLHSDWWEHQMADLVGHGMRCIAYDRRGHGRSVEPAGGYEFDTLADDLSAVIEQLDLRGVTLVGQSVGCGELVRYVSRHGTRRITRIAMVAPIAPITVKTLDNPDGVESGYLEKVREALCQDRPHAIAGAAPAFFGVPKNPVSAEMMQWWTDMLLQCSLRVLLELHRAFTVTDFRPDLSTISLPTVIIHGDNDTSTPIDLTGRKVARLISGSELKVYENAAHGLPITHMDRLNRDLFAFAKV
ncbi:MAG TPA: alpha/beta hydrolase [Candidatus Acidoferrum sp.]|nr:alpha/beta hydrolase [Candidatus Acidoferrum sp.]